MDLRVKTILLLSLTAGCAALRPTGPETLARVEDATGTIRRVGNFGYGIVPDSDPGTRYAPDRLPVEFQVDSLRVIFSGVAQSPAANVRLWGTSFRLTAIRRAEPAAP
jgi:hypothetical protein